MISKNLNDLALGIIHRLAIEHGLKLATAESLTAGLIASTIAETAGCSAYHQGGIVAYNIDAKVGLLGVDRDLAEACNCVSETVAMQMALGAKQRFDADLVVAVTGYAQAWPEGGIDEPFAHFTVLCGTASSQGVIQLAELGRHEARFQVVNRTLCELAAMMEAAYA
jgi:nicotinamide-nucleotide amidase